MPSNMMLTRLLALFVCAVLVAACSDANSKGGKFVPNSLANNTTNNSSNNISTCGNGALDPGEACDPAIAAGSEGACPTECPSEAACGTLVLEGAAAACSAQCVLQENACGEADGCCPSGCDSQLDDDCTNTCGDGITEGPELCDGDCPAMCDDGVACTDDVLVGAPETCNVACEFPPITACADDDGCCPSGCTSMSDNDCSGSCGDGTTDPGELCDGADCPTSCEDNNACTNDVLVGSAATCSAQCSYSPVTTCRNGDGCCPASCTFAQDNDCNCTPSSCAQLGVECGTVADGCGGTVSCGGCPGNEVCVANTCQMGDSVGNACTTDSQCGTGGGCLTESQTALPGGYCTLGCSSDANCPGGNCWEDQGICVDSCSSNADCRTNYECFDWTGDGVRECGPSATGFGSPGDSCSGYSDCAGGRFGFCFIGADFSNGYCTLECGAGGTTCPSGSHCLDRDFCVDSCTSNANCRAGYACYDVDSDGRRECWPTASGTGQVGDSCTSITECSGGQDGFCAAEDADGNWPGGYCSRNCDSTLSCPSGSECYDPDGTGGFCLKACTTGSDCRSSYVCDGQFALPSDVCIY